MSVFQHPADLIAGTIPQEPDQWHALTEDEEEDLAEMRRIAALELECANAKKKLRARIDARLAARRAQ